ncbi:MAG TPA: hypothetical protein VHQ69_04830 [Methylomirabilota bacterium]|nr:hypothetical protein [Methylomirabilota bacterium]
MSPPALGLLVLAAISHATWNLLNKQSRHHLASSVDAAGRHPVDPAGGGSEHAGA